MDLRVFVIVAEGDRPPLRGGKMLARDPWFGLSAERRFAEFRRWWHRVGKRELGRDLMTRREAFDIYAEWDRSNPPGARR